MDGDGLWRDRVTTGTSRQGVESGRGRGRVVTGPGHDGAESEGGRVGSRTGPSREGVESGRRRGRVAVGSSRGQGRRSGVEGTWEGTRWTTSEEVFHPVQTQDHDHDQYTVRDFSPIGSRGTPHCKTR